MEFETVECPIEFEVRGETRNLPEKAHLCLYRAGQECVTNAKRHASATRVALTIDYTTTDSVSLTVSDNGSGAGDLEEGFGIIGMRERSEDVGGSVTIHTAADHGFVIEIRVPG
jgi:signal transduction histidine kinase